MVTIKFTVKKESKLLVVIPTMVVDYSGTAKNAVVELFFNWLNGMLNVTISWTRNVASKETASKQLERNPMAV